MQTAKKIEFNYNEEQDLKGKVAAIYKSQAVIEFDLNGNILFANDNFLKVMNYTLHEIQGKHHSMFVDKFFANSNEYKELWNKLNRGEFETGEFKRIGKNGKDVYIQASYNPIFDEDGRPYKVIKFASDITEQKIKNLDFEGQLAAVSKTQAVIEFNLDGTIIKANDNFLNTLGYSLNEIQGKHHSMFCETQFVQSPEYKAMWQRLARGEFETGEFKRIGKNGKEVYIQASYNPIFDLNGKPYKVVKYATDISLQKLKDQELLALSKTQAVIEFNLDGTIVKANDNFLTTLGYRLDEITGKHHSMFCDPSYVASHDYKTFWANLNAGKFQMGQFKRIAKGGNEVWIQASYNPVFDLDGRVFKVVKYATDITKQKQEWNELVRTLASTATQLASASEELSSSAISFSNTAKKTTEQSQSATKSSEDVAKGVQIVATNTEEMVASIKEIAKSTSEGSVKTKESLKKAQETNKIISELGDSSKEIGSVIKVISAIAQQTNLLALNATIEAARAGEAGKGFAVVANEVKELAKQTAKATDDISYKVNSIQGSTGSAVQAIGEIFNSISQLNSISTTIAAAIEEQTATTNEVSRVVAESRKGVDAIAATVKEVSSAAAESSIGAGQLLDAAKELSHLAARLRDLVNKLN
ncbi:MAG: PAS domain-containing protein [Bacteriovoracaceae bacterium]